MTDKENIRNEVKKLQKRAEHNFDISLTENERQFWLGESNVLTLIGKYIDSLQEEPVRGDFEMALAEMIDKAQKCVVEPWVVAAQWKDELVKLAKECKAMQEHPKDCMYSKDNYTDEDRKILCEGCEEECRFNKED